MKLKLNESYLCLEDVGNFFYCGKIYQTYKKQHEPISLVDEYDLISLMNGLSLESLDLCWGAESIAEYGARFCKAHPLLTELFS